MSAPARAEGYDTPAQQRDDSTTLTVSIDSDQRPTPMRSAASPALHAPTHSANLVEPDWLAAPIPSLPLPCLGSVGARGDTLAHPDRPAPSSRRGNLLPRASGRHAALLTELLAWARAQSPTSPAGGGGPSANGGGNGRGGGER